MNFEDIKLGETYVDFVTGYTGVAISKLEGIGKVYMVCIQSKAPDVSHMYKDLAVHPIRLVMSPGDSEDVQ